MGKGHKDLFFYGIQKIFARIVWNSEKKFVSSQPNYIP